MHLHLLVALNILSIIVLAYWLKVYILEIKKLPRLVDEEIDSPVKVSVVIPARNEESRIRKCLDSVLKQRDIISQIIVADDSSVDGTRKIVEEYCRKYNVELIEVVDRPPNSIGKSWPCYLGYRKTKNDYILFIDADTIFLDERVVAKAVKTLEFLRLDYLSLFPRFGLYNLLALFVYPLYINTVIFFERFSKVNRGDSSKCFLVGAFSLFRKKTYESSGGHMLVLDEVLEDKIMGEKIRALGYSFRLFDGSREVETLVENRVKDIWASILRFMAGLKNKIKVVIFLLAFYLLVFLVPLVSAFILSDSFIAVSILPIFMSMLLNSLELSRNGRSVVYSIGYLLAVLLLVAIMVYILFSIIRGKIEFNWKERRYVVKA